MRLAADNEKYNTYKIHKNWKKKSYVTVPAKTLHAASLTYTQLFVNKSIPYLQPIAMNLFWCSLDSAYSIGLFEQCILYQNINLRWSTRKDIGSVLQKNWRGLVLSLQQHEKIRRKQLFQATLTLCTAGCCQLMTTLHNRVECRLRRKKIAIFDQNIIVSRKL